MLMEEATIAGMRFQRSSIHKHKLRYLQFLSLPVAYVLSTHLGRSNPVSKFFHHLVIIWSLSNIYYHIPWKPKKQSSCSYPVQSLATLPDNTKQCSYNKSKGYPVHSLLLVLFRLNSHCHHMRTKLSLASCTCNSLAALSFSNLRQSTMACNHRYDY